ncbi:hypothetical protein HDU67_002171 [Dinochytrium kinnereticum]|nr:hypothetical protein HDU67_002171 [Dinochytrium kinnereticum]
MFIAKIITIAAAALAASASLVSNNNGGYDQDKVSSSVAATKTDAPYGAASTVAPVPTSTSTPSKKKCKKWHKKPEYLAAAAEKAALEKSAGGAFDDAPQLIGNGGFQVSEPEQPPAPPAEEEVNQPPVVEQRPQPAPEPVVPEPTTPEPVTPAPVRDGAAFCRAILAESGADFDKGGSDSELRAELVRRTNNIRSIAGSFLGFDAKTVRYGSSEEGTSQNYASSLTGSRCPMVHSASSQRSTFGENLAQWSGLPVPSNPFAIHLLALHEYVKECSDMLIHLDGGRGLIDGGDDNFGKFGHLSQILWNDSTTVGCGICTASGNILSVCHYGPNGGNIGGRTVAGTSSRL